MNYKNLPITKNKKSKNKDKRVANVFLRQIKPITIKYFFCFFRQIKSTQPTSKPLVDTTQNPRISFPFIHFPHFSWLPRVKQKFCFHKIPSNIYIQTQNHSNFHHKPQQIPQHAILTYSNTSTNQKINK